jgi:TatD DNase family protein
MIDAHIHLYQYVSEHLHHQIERWKAAGIRAVIAVANDLPSSYRTLELKDQFPDFVHAAVGFHPEQPLPPEKDFVEWEKLISAEREKITAIGEIGLPHYNVDVLPHTLSSYTDFLARCLEIARSENLPVALHAVHAKASIVFDLLQQKQIKRAHFHWLKAPAHVLNSIIKAGYYVSVTPEVCYRSRDQQLARTVPMPQLLIETDGPWQYDQRFKHLQTTPLLLNDIIRQLARIKGVSESRVRQETLSNTKKCYGL